MHRNIGQRNIFGPEWSRNFAEIFTARICILQSDWLLCSVMRYRPSRACVLILTQIFKHKSRTVWKDFKKATPNLVTFVLRPTCGGENLDLIGPMWCASEEGHLLLFKGWKFEGVYWRPFRNAGAAPRLWWLWLGSVSFDGIKGIRVSFRTWQFICVWGFFFISTINFNVSSSSSSVFSFSLCSLSLSVFRSRS